MVGAIVVLFLLWAVSGWAFNRYAKLTTSEIATLKRENLSCAKAVVAQGNRIDEGLSTLRAFTSKEWEDHEARIAFLENSLTAKTSQTKIVPKAHKTTFRQFAAAAEAASDPETAKEQA